MFRNRKKETQDIVDKFERRIEDRLTSVMNEVLGSKLDQVDTMLRETLVDPVNQSKIVEDLRREVQTERNRLSEARTTRKNEERELKVLIKVAEEQNKIEIEKERLKIKGEYLDKEMELQRNYHDRQLAQMAEFDKKQDSFIAEVMKRLPNVNMQMESIGSTHALAVRETEKKDA